MRNLLPIRSQGEVLRELWEIRAMLPPHVTILNLDGKSITLALSDPAHTVTILASPHVILVDQMRIVWFCHVVTGFTQHQGLLEEEQMAHRPLLT